MGFNLSKDWPVYILLVIVAFFYIYVIVKSNLDDRKDKKDQNKETKKTEEKR